MAQGQVSSTGGQNGREKRAYPRYPVSLKARIVHSAKGECDIFIRDYCIGGMYLECIPAELLGIQVSGYKPNVGDSVEIVTIIILEGQNKQLSFSSKVMRVEEGYIGISFINPDIAILQSLHKFATSAGSKKVEEDGVGFESTPTEFNGKKSSQLILEAHQLVAKELNPLMEKFHASISESFFEAAKETTDMVKQNAIFESLGILEKNKKKISSAFAKTYQTKINEYSPSSILHEDNKEETDFSVESLSLVEADDLDNWLSISSIINNVDADNRDELSKIERRASALYRTKIKKQNNPFGPAIFAQTFQDVIETIELKHAVKLVCYTTFRDVYLSIAEKLYENLNQFFVDNDVLPKLKFKVERAAGSKQSTSSRSSVSNEATEFEDDGLAEGHTNQAHSQSANAYQGNSQSGHSQSDGNQQGNPNSVAVSAASPGQVSQLNQTANQNLSAATVSQGRDIVQAIHQFAVQENQNDLLNIFSDIRGLQNNLNQVQQVTHAEQFPGAQVGQASANTSTAVPVQNFSSTELLDALSSQELTGYDYSSQSSTGQTDFKGKIQSILTAQGSEAENKTIGEQEGRVIDVASNVFSSLMNDFQVAESIRPWIKQLEVPVLKMAIMDNDVFVEPSHPVQQVINKISELEILSDAENQEEQLAVKNAFNWMVKVINEDFDGTIKVFERIAQQLDLLIKAQNNTFDKNLKSVVADVISEGETKQEKEQVIDLENEWARKVSRLEIGDWVLFDAFSEKPIRLKVGWIAKRKGKYVFVNVLGEKEKVIHADELIQLFKDGETIALDSAEDPAMDRAQYSMLQKLHKQLIFQSTHDHLTGLINRREFEEHVEKALDDAKILNIKHALCYIDLDKFNVINNSCGYEGGDVLINQISEILKKHLSGKSVLSRLGGDEFCILLCGLGTDEALEVMENILSEFNDFRFVWEDKRLSVAMSIGLVIIKGVDQSVSKLMQDAESSCGVAKEIGGHRVQVYHEGHARLSKRHAEVEWAGKIDKALDEDSLHLRCQRIMPLAAEDSYHDHYEILLGMTDDLGKQSSLQEFINAAESYKRMSEIDRWVIKKSFNWIADNRNELDHVSSFSINLSGHSLNDLGLMDFVIKQMQDSKVPIGKICFEITETLGIASLSDASNFIKRFKTIGCKFSLDDFGSGMSSYGYLKSLPVDYLKIDGVFVKEMATNPNDYAVVKSISEIAHFMGKQVIAEYVQDEETIHLLKELGVDYAQGYGIEKPRKLEELLK